MPLSGEDATMKFKKLSKEKRQQLVLVAISTIAVLGLLGFCLIKMQYAKLDGLADSKVKAQAKLAKMRETVKNAGNLQTQLVTAKQTLADEERDMATGDLYSWVVNTMRRFKAAYKVEVPQYGQLGGVSDVTLLPNFPYRQTTLTVSGSAHFHDFGKFLADFENQFPHMRVTNLGLELNPAPLSGEAETLSFRMEVAILVKPAQS
jgi:cell division protein FtsB